MTFPINLTNYYYNLTIGMKLKWLLCLFHQRNLAFYVINNRFRHRCSQTEESLAAWEQLRPVPLSDKPVQTDTASADQAVAKLDKSVQTGDGGDEEDSLPKPLEECVAIYKQKVITIAFTLS